MGDHKFGYLGRGNTYASPVLAGKYIYVFGMNGITVVFEPGREYKEVARNKMEGYSSRKVSGFSSTPVAEGDRLYIRGNNYMYCIGKK